MRGTSTEMWCRTKWKDLRDCEHLSYERGYETETRSAALASVTMKARGYPCTYETSDRGSDLGVTAMRHRRHPSQLGSRPRKPTCSLLLALGPAFLWAFSPVIFTILSVPAPIAGPALAAVCNRHSSSPSSSFSCNCPCCSWISFDTCPIRAEAGSFAVFQFHRWRAALPWPLNDTYLGALT